MTINQPAILPIGELADSSEARVVLYLGGRLVHVAAGTLVTGASGNAAVLLKADYDPDNDGRIAIANGGTGKGTAAEAREALGLAIGADVQAYSANLTAWSALGTSAKQDASTQLTALAAFTAEFTASVTASVLVTAINAGKAIVVYPDVTSVTLTTTAQVQSVLGALDKILVLGSSFTINLPSGQHAISAASTVRSAKIKLMGAATVSTTITSIASVTGAAGNWSVTANLASSAGISVGDVLKITGVTPGVQAPGLNTGRPPQGALQMQFFQLGSLSNVGAAFSVTGTGLTDYISSGDFLVADGQVKRIVTPTTSGFAVDAANVPPKNITSKQYWYTMRPVSAGTVTISGTTVTCSGDFFSTRVNPGDILCVNGHGMRKVASVDSGTQLTLTAGGMDVVTASIWGVIVPGENHEGAWVVTAIVGNQVTWTNTAQTSHAPPVRHINGGTVTALKTNLIFAGTSAFVVDDVTLEMDRIGLRGSGGSATVAIDLRGVGSNRSGKATLGSNVAVTGFHYGSRLITGSALYADSTAWGGQITRGHDITEGGKVYLGNCVVNGSGGIGVFIAAGGYARLAAARIQANASQGVRIEVGGSTWADFAIVGYNGGANVLVVGGVNYHFVGTKSFGGLSHGFNGQNGGYGRATGWTAICNVFDGIGTYNSKGEMSQAILIGNGRYGALAGNTDLDLGNSGIGYNGSSGARAEDLSNVDVDGSNFFSNGIALYASMMSRIAANNTGFEGNTTDGQAETRGLIYVKGQSGGATWSPTLNTAGADGSLVTDA